MNWRISMNDLSPISFFQCEKTKHFFFHKPNKKDRIRLVLIELKTTISRSEPFQFLSVYIKFTEINLQK